MKMTRGSGQWFILTCSPCSIYQLIFNAFQCDTVLYISLWECVQQECQSLRVGFSILTEFKKKTCNKNGNVSLVSI